MLAPVLHILPLATILRERLLPIPGKVKVHLNQKVAATDVIAETAWAREHVLLDVARTLGVSVEAANRLIRCKVGERLSQGSIVAEDGIIRRTIHVPREGRVVAVGGGKILLEVGNTNLELRAGIPGIITQIIPDRGAVIQTAGALIQGVWGNGRVDASMMYSLIDKPDDMLTVDRLDASLRGLVILAGQCRDAEVLQAAAELPLRGLILSSLLPLLIPTALQMRYPITVTDGLGHMPMNIAAFKLLSTNCKREAAVNAEPYDRYKGTRPEVIVPLPVSQDPPLPRDEETFVPGQQLRMRRAPHAGEIGTLVNLRPGLTTLPSGLRATAGEVRLYTGEQILVPLINLEVVG